MENSLKIICNSYTNRISYLFKNETDEWIPLSGSSPLSRQYYTTANLAEQGTEVIGKICEIYNRKNKGLDITYEGSKIYFDIICNTLKENFSTQKVACKYGASKVIVAGKKGVGKSTLIEAIGKKNEINFEKIEQDGYITWADNQNNTFWYEVNGIDFNKESIENARSTIEKLAQNNATIFIYCIESTNRRIEDIEKTFVRQMKDNYSELACVLLLTQTTNKKGIEQFVENVEKLSSGIKTIPILASEFETDVSDEKNEPFVLKSFGLDELSDYIFEGR